MSKKKTICVSGGFDPVHVGHLRMMQEAAAYGDVIVIVNSDKWLMRKKGYIFMPFKERCEILEGLDCVTVTSHVADFDNTVCEALQRLRPDYFANGGDRKTDNTPEMEVCSKLGIELLWNIGGGKIQSSSTLVNDAGMLMDPHPDDDPDLRPSRVDVLSSGDIPKSSDY
jgi:D-beta-D-heptose 7-phosphate kinase/D-beta-D-heptose 1-phosphate adenosyltransferase